MPEVIKLNHAYIDRVGGIDCHFPDVSVCALSDRCTLLGDFRCWMWNCGYKINEGVHRK